MLTARQKTFLQKLVEIYLEENTSIHYTELANEVGVSKFTAYDMLRVLEKKGYVSSQYILDKDASEPGRSLVNHYPTEKALRIFGQKRHLGKGPRKRHLRGGRDWSIFQRKILEGLEGEKNPDLKELLKKSLLNLKGQISPVRYCAEVMATALIFFRNMKEGELKNSVTKIIKKIWQAGETKLSSLAGFLVGLCVLDSPDRDLAESFMACLPLYERYIEEMDEENRSKLEEMLDDFFSHLLVKG